MVFSITVRTIDSQNYQFEADDNWTVLVFKEHIQPTVNVPIGEQRLIFCGRVLQDDKKLTEYGCSGKVIHLVRRPPPSANEPDRRSSAVDSDSARNGMQTDDNRGFEDGQDNVLVSTMTFTPDSQIPLLRQILTIQQVYDRADEANLQHGLGPESPPAASNVDRHLHSCFRLLRLVADIINEFCHRISTLPCCPIILPTIDIDHIRRTSSNSNAQQEEEMQTSDNSQSSPGSNQSAPSNNEARVIPQDLANSTPLQQFHHLLICFDEIQDHRSLLCRRFARHIRMAYDDPDQYGPIRTASAERPDDTETPFVFLPPIAHEFRYFGYYLPRILHHMSHLEHAISDFTAEMVNERCQLVLPLGPRGVRPQLARRSNPPSYTPFRGSNYTSEQALRDTDRHRQQAVRTTLGGAVALSALRNFQNQNPDAVLNVTPSATIVVTAEPASFPLGSQGINVSVTQNPETSAPRQTLDDESNEATQAQHEQPEQDRANQQQNTARNQGQPTRPPFVAPIDRIPIPFDHYLPCTSPWTNYTYPIRTDRSNPSSSHRIYMRTSRPQSNQPSNADSTRRRNQQRDSSQRSNRSRSRSSDRGNSDIPSLNTTLNRLLDQVLGGLDQAASADQASGGLGQFPEMMSRATLHAARGILAGVLGYASLSTPTQSNNSSVNNQSQTRQAQSQSQPQAQPQQTQPQQPQPQPQPQPQRQQQQQAGSQECPTIGQPTVMMEIDIDDVTTFQSDVRDDSSSSHSESRFQDAHDSPMTTAPGHLPSARPSTSTNFNRDERTSVPANIEGSRSNLTDIMRSHPEWIPQIEADLKLLDQQRAKK